MPKIDVIFFIGPQGSGKGTQAKKLANRLGFFYWEMGGILRQMAEGATDLGREVKNLIDRGALLNDELLLRVVTKRLEALPETQGIIFDGIPRRLGQAEFLNSFLKNHGRQVMVTIFIDLPRADSISRLLKRAEMENRQDDTREAIEFRLNQYGKDTVPVLNYLKSHSKFITIDGQPSVDEVESAINRALEL